MTPEWEIYKEDDGKEGTSDAPPEDLEPTSEANDDYVNVNIMLSLGSEMSRGQFTGHKHDIDGNTSRQASDNPILHMQDYTVQIEYGEVT